MKISIDRGILLKALNHVQSVVERRNTIPILSNVKIDANEKNISLIATDLDLEIIEFIDANVSVSGSTTVSAHTLYDIVRKIPEESMIEMELNSNDQMEIKSGQSNFDLPCLPDEDFPEMSSGEMPCGFSIESSDLARLIDKARFAISTEETRYYLNGIFLHLTEAHGRNFLTGVATDSHRLSSSSLEIDSSKFNSIILPRKTVFQLCSLLSESTDQLNMQTSENKIKFTLGKIKLISKVIDGKFPDYKKVVPTDNKKILSVSSRDFINSIERVASVSLDRKEGVRLLIEKDNVQLSVNSANSGDGNEKIKAKFNDEKLNISFNSKYLIEIASEIEDKNMKMNFKDSTLSLIHI